MKTKKIDEFLLFEIYAIVYVIVLRVNYKITCNLSKLLTSFTLKNIFKAYTNTIQMPFSKLLKLLIDCIKEEIFLKKKTFYELFNYLFWAKKELFLKFLFIYLNIFIVLPKLVITEIILTFILLLWMKSEKKSLKKRNPFEIYYCYYDFHSCKKFP